MTAHENLGRTHEVQGSSDRSFGWVFAGAFALIACWPLLYGEAPRAWALVAAAAFAVVAQLRPVALARLNRLWIRLGLLLGRLVSPIVLAILFYGVITPIGAVMRVAGKDPLRLKRGADSQSHWLPRKPPGPPPDSMTNQF